MVETIEIDSIEVSCLYLYFAEIWKLRCDICLIMLV